MKFILSVLLVLSSLSSLQAVLNEDDYAILNLCFEEVEVPIEYQSKFNELIKECRNKCYYEKDSITELINALESNYKSYNDHYELDCLLQENEHEINTINLYIEVLDAYLSYSNNYTGFSLSKIN